jgi:hypothetical protein
MTAIGGSIESVSLSGREFAMAADVEVNRKVGGYENEVLPNGNGTARLIQTRVAFVFDGLNIEIDDARDDQGFVQALADGHDFFPITVTYASGITYQGFGQIVGEIQFSNQTSSATVSLSGTGKATPQ